MIIQGTDDDDEVEIEEETEEETLFDDTSKASETLLKTDEKDEKESQNKW